MKELDALMKAMEKEKIKENLILTVKLVPIPEKDPEKRQELVNGAIRACILHKFADNEALGELFSKYSFELGMKELIKELDIKAPEDGSEAIDKFIEFLKNL